MKLNVKSLIEQVVKEEMAKINEAKVDPSDDKKINSLIKAVNILIEKGVDEDGDPLAFHDPSSTWQEEFSYKPVVRKGNKITFISNSPHSNGGKDKVETELIGGGFTAEDTIATLRSMISGYKRAYKKAGIPLPSMASSGADTNSTEPVKEAEGEESPKIKSSDVYIIVDTKSNDKKVGGPYASRSKATSIADKKDNEYGAYRYSVQYVKPEDYAKYGIKEGEVVDEATTTLVTADGKTLTPTQQAQVKTAKPGTTIVTKKAGEISEDAQGEKYKSAKEAFSKSKEGDVFVLSNSYTDTDNSVKGGEMEVVRQGDFFVPKEDVDKSDSYNSDRTKVKRKFSPEKLDKNNSSITMTKVKGGADNLSENKDKSTEDTPPVDDKAVELTTPAESSKGLAGELNDHISAAIDAAAKCIQDSGDKKYEKVLGKVVKNLTAAQSALDDVQAHETKLAEEAAKEQEKTTASYTKDLRKVLKKNFKNPEHIEKLVTKYGKVIKQSTGKPVEKIAEMIAAHALKEGFVKKGDILNENLEDKSFEKFTGKSLLGSKINSIKNIGGFNKDAVLITTDNNLISYNISDDRFSYKSNDGKSWHKDTNNVIKGNKSDAEVLYSIAKIVNPQTDISVNSFSNMK